MGELAILYEVVVDGAAMYSKGEALDALHRLESTIERLTKERDEALAQAGRMRERAEVMQNARDQAERERDEARAAWEGQSETVGKQADIIASLRTEVERLREALEVIARPTGLLSRKAERAEAATFARQALQGKGETDG